jgi:hypothetical protein
MSLGISGERIRAMSIPDKHLQYTKVISINVKYYPPLKVDNNCKHDDYYYLDSTTWRDAEGQHVILFTKCWGCDVLVLREELYE